ncbi:MAG: murein biosynthesis integral membrane protein MurJ [Mycobacteriales bacterium]
MSQASLSGASLSRASGAMAVGTLASRLTGFLRTVALAAALGVGHVSDAYNVGNTTPNIVYDLLLGGILSSVIVPLLVRAQREDEDGGERFTASLVTLAVVALTAASVLGIVAAPLLMRLYLAGNAPAAERRLAIEFTRFFLPQMIFYGLTAAVTAILNTRRRFGAPAFAPVLNNLIVIGTVAVFLALPGRHPLRDGLTGAQTFTLGAGTTLGVVVMAVALLPQLRQVGVRLRPRLDLSDPRLRQAWRLGGWVLAYAAVNQVGYVFITRFANSTRGGYTAYSYAYQLFQLPHAIIAVSVISALLPRMSGHAAGADLPGVRRDLSRGIRLAAVLLVPAALGLVALGEPVAVAAFRHGATTPAAARLTGDALAAMAVGLPAFSAYQLLLRAFYAQADSRTPALVNVVVNVVNVGADAAVVVFAPAHDRVIGLALGLSVSYLCGSALAGFLLRRPLGGLDGARVTRLAVRVTLAAGLAAGLTRVVADLVRTGLGAGAAAALVATIAGGGVGLGCYVWAVRRMRVRELGAVLALLPRPAAQPR